MIQTAKNILLTSILFMGYASATDTIIKTDLGGPEDGVNVTLKIASDHYNISRQSLAPQYEILVNGKKFTDKHGNSLFDVKASRDKYSPDTQKMTHEVSEYEYVSFRVEEDIKNISINYVSNVEENNIYAHIEGPNRYLIVDKINIGGCAIECIEDGKFYQGLTLEAEDREHAQYIDKNGKDISGTEHMREKGKITFYPTILTDIYPPEQSKKLITFKLTSDYCSRNGEDGSPIYEIFVNGEKYVSKNGETQFRVHANRDRVFNNRVYFDTPQSEYVFIRVPEDLDVKTVAIKFINDDWDGRERDLNGNGILGEDRNIIVDFVNIGGQQYTLSHIQGGKTVQAEDKTHTKYITKRGIDKSGQEEMYWNGTMTFNIE